MKAGVDQMAYEDANAAGDRCDEDICRVLVVEDDTESANFLARALLSHAHDVQTARNGTEALVVATSFRPHAIFIDIGLPGLDGLHVATQLRKLDRQMLIVATTGRSAPEDMARSLAAGFDHHLVKPLDLMAILDLLVQWKAMSGCKTA
jgi:DNA-binding response OmpR family regulator